MSHVSQACDKEMQAGAALNAIERQGAVMRLLGSTNLLLQQQSITAACHAHGALVVLLFR